jgi:LPXTG-site transpeptidase (sortase) family protein
MNGRRYSKILTVILIILIVAIIGLLGFLAFKYYEEKRTTNGASDYVDAFDQTIATETPDTTETDTSGNNTDDNSEINPTTEDNNTTSSGSTSGKTTTYQGFEVLGTIEIPKTNVKYPILAKLSSKALDTAVVAIYPSPATLNSVGNVVIAGHNYRNGTFFSNNKKLSTGDKIYIKDLDGNKETYIIYNIFETTDTDTSFYNRDTDGKKEITLSTCTDDSKARLIIEARVE